MFFCLQIGDQFMVLNLVGNIIEIPFGQKKQAGTQDRLNMNPKLVDFGH